MKLVCVFSIPVKRIRITINLTTYCTTCIRILGVFFDVFGTAPLLQTVRFGFDFFMGRTKI